MSTLWRLVLVTLLLPCYGETVPETVPEAARKLSNNETTQLLNELVSKMDFRVRPNVDGGPVVVTCGMDVVSFGEISDSNMDYSMDIYLRQSWYDERLLFPHTPRPLIINAQLIHHMWTPDVYFPTEKQAAFHDVTVPNKLVRVYSDGHVVYSMRLTLTLACPMDLSQFPMDHQECDFMLESYSNEDSDLLLEWDAVSPIEVTEGLELPQFDLKGVETVHCAPKTYKTGAFSCVRAKFRLARQYGFFLLQTYIPSILIVIISWVSLWINMDAVPARISLGVTTVLTMATQLSGSKASIPRISYPKAIDIWMVVCMFFVFGALIEYAFVNALSRKHQKRAAAAAGAGRSSQDPEMALQDDQEETSFELTRRKSLVVSLRKRFGRREAARMVDKVSRFAFPASFIIFNLFYWPYFTRV